MNITSNTIDSHLQNITEPRLSQIKQLVDMMQEVSNGTPKMWGTIIGFGNLHYTYDSGLSGNMPIIGLANRKQAITLYLSNDISQYKELDRLGRFSIGKSCLYVKHLNDINLAVLKELMIHAYHDVLTYDYVTLVE